MTYHRAQTHSLLYLFLLATPITAWVVSRMTHTQALFFRWCITVGLIYLTHPLLDLLTIYGTQLGIPFTDYPYAIGSIFIVDPLFTLPLLLGVIMALFKRNSLGLKLNLLGLIISSCYLVWGICIQQHVLKLAKNALVTSPHQFNKIVVTPTPLNTLLWRVVAVNQDGYAEGYYSVLDSKPDIQFSFYAKNNPTLYQSVNHNWHVQRMVWFTQGLYAIDLHQGAVVITDLRMGSEPCFTFSFELGQLEAVKKDQVSVKRLSTRHPTGEMLDWIRRRLTDSHATPPQSKCLPLEEYSTPNPVHYNSSIK